MNRAALAYCLGLVFKTTYNNLRHLAEIRNLFAHSHKPIDFENREVQENCAELKTLFDLMSTDEREGHGPIAAEAATNPRARLVLTAAITYSRLMVTVPGTQRRPRFAGGP